MALRGRRTNNFIESWCLVASGGLHFCVSSISFHKIAIPWPQQPRTERVSDISKILDFWWSIPQNGTGIDHLGAGDDQTIRISKKFDEMRLLRSLRPLRLLRPLRSWRLQKSWTSVFHQPDFKKKYWLASTASDSLISSEIYWSWWFDHP